MHSRSSRGFAAVIGLTKHGHIKSFETFAVLPLLIFSLSFLGFLFIFPPLSPFQARPLLYPPNPYVFSCFVSFVLLTFGPHSSVY